MLYSNHGHRTVDGEAVVKENLFHLALQNSMVLVHRANRQSM